jgi:hypothetical protein
VQDVFAFHVAEKETALRIHLGVLNLETIKEQRLVGGARGRTTGEGTAGGRQSIRATVPDRRRDRNREVQARVVSVNP